MNLIEYLDLFAGALINVMFYAIVIRKIFDLKMNKNKIIRYLFLILTSIIVGVINIYNKDVFKILLTIPFVVVGIKFIFNQNTIECIYYTLIATVYLFIGEIITSIILSLFPVGYMYVFNNILGKSIGNIFVVLFTLPFVYIKVLKKLSQKLLKMISKKKLKEILTLCICILLLIGAFTYKNTTSVDNVILIFVNLIIYIIFMLITVMLYQQSKKTEKLSSEYNVLLKYLEKYEIELDEKRKIVHDFKNQLIVINGYADESNAKLKEYILEIINDQKKLSPSSLIKGIDRLPKGIKGLVYYKLSSLDKTYIVEINVKDDLNAFNNINSKMSKNILKIIGILIDNAIEAVNSLDKKYINLNFTCTNKRMIIEVINNFDKKVDVKKVMASGYSTKGENRGYGLAIVNDIAKANTNVNVKIVNEKNLFKAVLKINVN